MRPLHMLLTVATSLGGLAVCTHAADVIYATNHMGNYPELGMNTLVKFSADDPAGFETIGPLGVEGIGFGGLEFDADGNLWAYATFNSFGGAASGLYSIDLDTGAATLQGSQSSQTLSDLAFNPVDNTMYGVFSQGFATSRLYEVDLESGDVTLVGTFTGLDAQHNAVGLAVDSTGMFYLYDNMNNKLYRADATLSVTLLYDDGVLQCDGCALAVGSQGIAVDWSRDDTGYHGAIGQGPFPNYYNNLNTFAGDGSAYLWGPDFGPNHPDGLPQVQPGDLAILPSQATTPGDLDGSGTVDGADLAMLLGAWGDCVDCDDCDADLNDSCTVDGADLAVLLGNWG